MPGEYLWDRGGKPDPEVERLEHVLGRLRSDPREAPWIERPARIRLFPARAWLPVAAAAAIVVAAGIWLAGRRPLPGWEVASLAGAPRVGANPLTGQGVLAVGQWLETDGESRARITVGSIGEVEVEPSTQLRLVEARQSNHRLALKRGAIRAFISAPPRLFFVETPSAVAVDLGCAYTLRVDEAGTGVLSVSSGWVSFQHGGRESFVPAGASCATRPGTGPGTPYFDDSTEAFRAALDRLDFEGGGGEALAILLAESRRRDVLTFWHLLSRVDPSSRGLVFDRMAALVDVPDGVTREGALRGDPQMLRLWWEDLGLEESGWWREP